MVKVAWVSRHPPLRGQIEELKRMLGDVEITQIGGTFRDAKDVVETVKEAGADISVVVLPLSMLAQYLPLAQKGGVDVWFARMEGIGEVEEMPRDFNSDTDVLLPMHGSNMKRWMRFKEFEKVKEVRVVTEPITGMDLMKYNEEELEM